MDWGPMQNFLIGGKTYKTYKTYRLKVLNNKNNNTHLKFYQFPIYPAKLIAWQAPRSILERVSIVNVGRKELKYIGQHSHIKNMYFPLQLLGYALRKAGFSELDYETPSALTALHQQF